MPHYRKTSDILAELRTSEYSLPHHNHVRYGPATKSSEPLPPRKPRWYGGGPGLTDSNIATTLASVDTLVTATPSEAGTAASSSSFVARSLRFIRRKSTGVPSRISFAPTASQLSVATTAESHRDNHSLFSSGVSAPSSASSWSGPSPRTSLASRAKPVPDNIVIISRETEALRQNGTVLSSESEATSDSDGCDSGYSTPEISPTSPSFPDFLRAGTPRLTGSGASASPRPGLLLSSLLAELTETDECPSLYNDASSDTDSSCNVSTFGELTEDFAAKTRPSTILVSETDQQHLHAALQPWPESASAPLTRDHPEQRPMLDLTTSFPSPPGRRVALAITPETVPDLMDDYLPRRAALELFAGETRAFVPFFPTPPNAKQNGRDRPIAADFFDLL